MMKLEDKDIEKANEEKDPHYEDQQQIGDNILYPIDIKGILKNFMHLS